MATAPEQVADTDVAATAVRRDSVIRALQTLTRRERSVVVHRYFLDLTEQQTADELGISVGTVKSTNARAMAKLRISPQLTQFAADRPGGLAIERGL